MDLMIKYRNERKAEGATAAELSIYDGKIHSMLSSCDQTANTLDMELLLYRKQKVAEGASRDIIALIEKQIHKQFGLTPARIGDVIVRSISGSSVNVSIDFNNSTIEDLYDRVAAAIGSHSSAIRIIQHGKYIENSNTSLMSINIKPGDTVNYCMKMGCNGRCCEMNYNIMYDALLRSKQNQLSLMKKEDIHEFAREFAMAQTSFMKSGATKPFSTSEPVECFLTPSRTSPPLFTTKVLNLNAFKALVGTCTKKTELSSMTQSVDVESPPPSPPPLPQPQSEVAAISLNVEDLYG